MSNLAVAFGLVLVIEGTLWALAPGLGRKFLEAVADSARIESALGGCGSGCGGRADHLARARLTPCTPRTELCFTLRFPLRLRQIEL